MPKAVSRSTVAEPPIDELAQQPGDHVIRKWRPSAFFRTDFEVFLGVRAIDTLLVAERV